jgi:hypothetical protein
MFLILISGICTYSQVAQNWWALSPSAKENSYFYVQLILNGIKVVISFWLTKVLCVSTLYQYIHDDAIKGLLFSPMSYFQNTPIDKVIGILSNDLTVNDTVVTFELNYSLVNFNLLLNSLGNIIYVYILFQSYYVIGIFLIFCIVAYYFFAIYFVLSIRALRL